MVLQKMIKILFGMSKPPQKGKERNFCRVHISTESEQRRGGNISQPYAFLDLGQSANGANPDRCAKEQPLKKYRAADIILLECSVA